MQLTVMVKKNEIILSSQSSDVGTTNEQIKSQTEGEPITLSFNQKYIAEIMPFVFDESVTLHFAGIGRPMVLEGAHDRTLRYLVMPMNK